MSERARERNAERHGKAPRPAGAVAAPEPRESPAEEPEARGTAREAAAALDNQSFFPGSFSDPNVVAMPTSEVVARVVAQYRGGLSKVAEVLGRNRRNLMELLEKLNLMEHVVALRAAERKRILAAPLKDRLSDLLFKEKLLEDLGCLQELDEATKRDIQARCAALARTTETADDVLHQLGAELGLEEAGLKRLVWRYELRRQLRNMKVAGSKAPSARSRS